MTERKAAYDKQYRFEKSCQEEKEIKKEYEKGFSLGQICEKHNFKMHRVYFAIFKVKVDKCNPKSHIDCLNCQYEDCINQSQGLFDFEKKLRPNIPKTSYTISMMIDRARAGRSSWNF